MWSLKRPTYAIIAAGHALNSAVHQFPSTLHTSLVELKATKLVQKLIHFRYEHSSYSGDSEKSDLPPFPASRSHHDLYQRSPRRHSNVGGATPTATARSASRTRLNSRTYR